MELQLVFCDLQHLQPLAALLFIGWKSVERDVGSLESSILTDIAVLARQVHPQSCIATLVHPVTQSEIAQYFQFKYLNIQNLF